MQLEDNFNLDFWQWGVVFLCWVFSSLVWVAKVDAYGMNQMISKHMQVSISEEIENKEEKEGSTFEPQLAIQIASPKGKWWQIYEKIEDPFFHNPAVFWQVSNLDPIVVTDSGVQIRLSSILDGPLSLKQNLNNNPPALGLLLKIDADLEKEITGLLEPLVELRVNDDLVWQRSANSLFGTSDSSFYIPLVEFEQEQELVLEIRVYGDDMASKESVLLISMLSTKVGLIELNSKISGSTFGQNTISDLSHKNYTKYVTPTKFEIEIDDSTSGIEQLEVELETDNKTSIYSLPIIWNDPSDCPKIKEGWSRLIFEFDDWLDQDNRYMVEGMDKLNLAKCVFILEQDSINENYKVRFENSVQQEIGQNSDLYNHELVLIDKESTTRMKLHNWWGDFVDEKNIDLPVKQPRAVFKKIDEGLHLEFYGDGSLINIPTAKLFFDRITNDEVVVSDGLEVLMEEYDDPKNFYKDVNLSWCSRLDCISQAVQNINGEVEWQNNEGQVITPLWKWPE